MVSMGGFEERTVEIYGYERPYFDNDRKDKPTLILLHGYADRKESWFPFANKLSKDFRIIIPDMMGHGDNEPQEGENYSLGDQATYLYDLKERLEISSFHLAGISMGGGIAGKYASRYSKGLRSVTFISSAGIAGCMESSDMDIHMSDFQTLEERKANFPLLPHSYTRANAKIFKQYIFHKKFFIPNRLFREYLKPLIEEREFYLQVLGDFVDVGTGHFILPMDDELSKITVPVCVIWGKQDPLLDATCAAVFAEQLNSPPDVTIIDNCGHATIVEQPRETMDAIKEFLTKVIQ